MTPKTKPFARTLTALSALIAGLAATPAVANGFQSPSGNINCYLDVFSSQPYGELDMICLIFETSIDLPTTFADEDPGCDLDRTRAFILPKSGPARGELYCHGDVFWPIPLGALSYGSEWSLSGYTCSMATDGVRCTNQTGHGFHVSRATHALD